MRTLYHIAKADFLERTRRYSFLIILVAAVYAAWIFVPPNDSTWSTMTIQGSRGVYNSAWVGAQVAILTALFLSLTGFYLVKGSLDRDYHTRVGQIIAATPLSKFKYAIGKLLSNAAVIWAIVLVMMAVAAVVQLVRGEDRAMDLFALITPFLYMMIPIALLIGGLAVLFECIPALRGGLGNVVYFFLIMGIMASQIFEQSDIFGLSVYLDSMKSAALAAFPSAGEPDVVINIGIRIEDEGAAQHLNTFQWDGLGLGAGMILGRLWVIALAVAMAASASLMFDRFDSARATEPEKKKDSRLSRLVTRIEDIVSPARSAHAPAVTGHLTPLAVDATNPRLMKTVMAELRIMLKGQHGIWYLASLVLVIVGLSVPMQTGLSVILPIAWIWPTLIWSQLGCREVRQGTNQYIFASARPVMRQLPASWLAGASLAMIVGGGVGLHLLMVGNIAGLLTWIVGAFFVPALALACGTWTNGSRLFEALYLFLWYAGPLNRVPALDYMGASRELHTTATTVGYAAVTMILFFLAVVGRRRQMFI